MSTEAELHDIHQALSTARLSTFESYTAPLTLVTPEALNLYSWNAAVSGAFLPLLHICEVTIRNSISTAISNSYNTLEWPWDTTFLGSLPKPSKGFNPHAELIAAQSGISNFATGKVIAELKFRFWNSMLTKRHDVRIWQPHIHTVFPNLPSTTSGDYAQGRALLATDLEKIRRFRNRIAHHEPIFKENLSDMLETTLRLIKYASIPTFNWASSQNTVSDLLVNKAQYLSKSFSI